jgi:hypothetical protein
MDDILGTRNITLAMLAHAFLAVMAVQEREKGVSRPTHPTSWASHQPKSSSAGR